jgi:hypothetical protein
MSNFIFDNIGGQTKMKKKRLVLKDFKKPQKIKVNTLMKMKKSEYVKRF